MEIGKIGKQITGPRDSHLLPHYWELPFWITSFTIALALARPVKQCSGALKYDGYEIWQQNRRSSSLQSPLPCHRNCPPSIRRTSMEKCNKRKCYFYLHCSQPAHSPLKKKRTSFPIFIHIWNDDLPHAYVSSFVGNPHTLLIAAHFIAS